MAFSNRGTNLPGIVAGEDLRLLKHRFINIDSTGRAVKSSAGGLISAILENNPNLDEAASLMGPGSVGKVTSGSAVLAGESVASDAEGRAVPAGPGAFSVGVCVESGAAVGELCSVFLTPQSSAALEVFDNASRPGPTTVNIGTCIYNTDDSAPNYSDGTIWRDAAGVAT